MDRGIAVFGVSMYLLGLLTAVIYFKFPKEKSIKNVSGTTAPPNVILYKLGSVHEANKQAFKEIKILSESYYRKINELDLSIKRIDQEIKRREKQIIDASPEKGVIQT